MEWEPISSNSEKLSFIYWKTVLKGFDSGLQMFSMTFNTFFVGNTFITNARLELAKNQAKANQHPETELLIFDAKTLSCKNGWRYSKKYTKNKYLCLNEVI